MTAAATAAEQTPDRKEAAFFPKPFEPPFAEVASPADGIWIPVTDPYVPQAPVAMYKTMVHPDARRSFAVLAVMAIDLSAYEIHLVAGFREPHSKHVPQAERPGQVPYAYCR